MATKRDRFTWYPGDLEVFDKDGNRVTLPPKRKSQAKLSTNEIEAANRAEATALLIRANYRVYRPEADCDGEDLVVRTPDGELRIAQLKGRPTVDWRKYGNVASLWMLFPDPKNGATFHRTWFLVPHEKFYEWVKARHGHTPGWNEAWHYPGISKELGQFLGPFALNPP